MKFFSKDTLEIIGLFTLWRLILLFVAFFGSGRYPIKAIFYDGGNNFNLYKAWANWDGVHYLSIAASGYLADLKTMIFFPGYPLLIKLTSFILGDFLLSAYLVSHFFAVGSLIMLYKFVLLKFSREIAQKAIFYFLIFPSSFYLVAAYSESTFIFFAILSLYFAFQKRWLLASVFALLISLTRVIGIVIIIPLILEYLTQINFSAKKLQANVLWLFLTPLGALSYMFYLLNTVGDPLYFLALQNAYYRSTSPLNPLTVLANYFNNLKLALLRGDIPFTTSILLDYLLTIVVLVSSFFVFKKIRISLGIYTFLIMLIPTLTGSLAANQRYALSAFPIFILLAQISKNPLINFSLTIIFLMLLTVSLTLFINGYWVA